MVYYGIIIKSIKRAFLTREEKVLRLPPMACFGFKVAVAPPPNHLPSSGESKKVRPLSAIGMANAKSKVPVKLHANEEHSISLEAIVPKTAYRATP
ncbi:hypothetical protein Tco_0860347 [Tanacetum coccineum]|uniref:Uncharacterized protein n=1 Tax=Tanacetum coccineum TaxID=301880 RepID=A0ABQ5BEP5_9ASTR